ncbi:MAG: MinD/ParA family protein [Pseudomonadota bacterium]
MARVITVTSGKGGVGKTNITVNLAIQLARKGVKTCIFDADLGLANINILLGVSPEYNLEDVISGEKSLREILVHHETGIDIIPGGTGVEKLAGLASGGLSELIEAFSCLEGYDILLFDTSAGISREVISFCMASMEVMLVVIPEPTSLTDGYSLLKVLSLNGYREPVKVIVNQAKNERFAEAVFNKFKETVRKYLPLEISYAGCLPADESVAEAVTRQRPFICLYPNGRASLGITRLVQHVLAAPVSDPQYGKMNTFWERYSTFVKRPFELPQGRTRVQNAEPTPPPLDQKSTTASSLPRQSVSADLISHQILESLNRLVSATTDISRELSEFRQTIKKSVAPGSMVQTEDGDMASQSPPVITLDFEAYVERKRKLPKSEEAK